MTAIRSFRDLDVYQLAFELAVEIHGISGGFPREEIYSLTDQIRRSSRFVCANIAESWRKRRYAGAFVSELSDAQTEAAEVQVWRQFAARFPYIKDVEQVRLSEDCDRGIGKLVRMIDRTEKWLIRKGGLR